MNAFSAARFDYTLQLGRMIITPQYKYMLFRLYDQERGRGIQFETRSIPILKVGYPFLPRTTLKAGFQGIGPLPYRSKYFGYDLIRIVGLNRDRQTFDNPAQELNEFDVWSFFVRGLIGFTEHGRPI